MRRYGIYVIILSIAVVLVVIVEMSRPEPVDWSDSFVHGAATPYGTYILYEQLDAVFPGQDVEVSEGTVYQTLAYRDDPPANYIFINSDLSFTRTDSDELLRYVADGGTVFMAAERFDGTFLDSLGVETNAILSFIVPGAEDSNRVNFVSPSLRADEPFTYGPSRTGSYHFFSNFDEESTLVLGTAIGEEDPDEPEDEIVSMVELRINFIKVAWGDGAFYLSTLPRAFANLGMLVERGHKYAASALSYLPPESVLWDEYYKAGRIAAQGTSQSGLRYIASQESLSWAYNLLIVGALLFIAFGARRRQRIIPVVEPPRNTTLEFVETVGRLYHQHGDFKNVAGKRILHLLDYVRTHLNLQTTTLDQQFMERVAERSGVRADRVVTLFNLARAVRNSPSIEADEFLQLSDAIEYFYRNTQR